MERTILVGRVYVHNEGSYMRIRDPPHGGGEVLFIDQGQWTIRSDFRLAQLKPS